MYVKLVVKELLHIHDIIINLCSFCRDNSCLDGNTTIFVHTQRKRSSRNMDR